jgi:protein MpaA
VFVARKLIELLRTDPLAGQGSGWVVIPVVNPDAYERRRRRNANNVDINRNFPTKNWALTSVRSRMYGGHKATSEPETRTVMRVIRRYRPSRIVTIHSIDQRRYCNNYDGPARALASHMKRCNGYPVSGSMGYPTPGSFGTWAGIEGGIPTITLELPSHHSPKQCWEDNRRALMGTS